ncbi:hypothetical protein TGVEG_235875 [Toxoplasma gondii VEG]|uniref:Uncharacterized protein n=1 Tax=Toxoplasma gondii (strain ATCC 50861 / VEG) TaxID=432359 RepID=V4ZAH0_TOXGV|nr:hypothetical protein TGVEG_235875 [Toxoplasma gondii VEG]
MEYATTPRLTFVAFASQDRSAVCREQHALREKRNAAGAKQRFSRSDTISHISGYSAGEHHDSQPTKRHPMATKNTRELGDGHTDFHTDNRGSRTPAVSQRCSWSLQASGNHGNTTSSESTTFSDSPASRSIEDAGSQAALRQSRAGCHGLSVTVPHAHQLCHFRG